MNEKTASKITSCSSDTQQMITAVSTKSKIVNYLQISHMRVSCASSKLCIVLCSNYICLCSKIVGTVSTFTKLLGEHLYGVCYSKKYRMYRRTKKFAAGQYRAIPFGVFE